MPRIFPVMPDEIQRHTPRDGDGCEPYLRFMSVVCAMAGTWIGGHTPDARIVWTAAFPSGMG
ncbi:hypothetical protein P3T76_011425 [Phytophthora citrophthora]|uniref:Uncharacterized protein n=1 Tax=Phytophthora citrophthora TaxID=4793 RepID=A0AAD9LFZ8_9STRA|nr:hypothetical protein P3T76_011425 [Phytophthora citrophthora]